MSGTDAARAAWATIAELDPEVWSAMRGEADRQRWKIELIASENYTFAAVMEAQGSWLTNKYAEGLPGHRYYGGCEYVDVVERLAQDRALALFPGAEHVNVQPHAGAPANLAAFYAVLSPGDRILGMSLADGGHLTHGSPVNVSGKWFEVHAYGVDRATERIDYDAVERLAAEVRPKLVIAGASSYSRTLDFERFASIAHGVGAYLLVDMAHIAGLVAAGQHPSPFPHADLVTTTTHKTLRGPRGGLIFSSPALARQVDKAVFPGTQGGPLMHIIAAKAVALRLAATPAFREDQRRTVENARILAAEIDCPGWARDHRGHGQPHAEHRRDAVRGDRPGSGAPPRRGRDHRQQERHPVRPEAAQHRLRDPHRHTSHHHARVRSGRDARDRPADGGVAHLPGRAGRAGQGRRRGSRHLRALPRPGAARGVTP